MSGVVEVLLISNLKSLAVHGAGSICVEASAVVPEGRISPEDNGIWSDQHIPQLKRVVDFVHAQGSVIGIQLAHAGRKSSTRAPWAQVDLGGINKMSESIVATIEEGGWPDKVFAPSGIPHDDAHARPKALTEQQIANIEQAFVQAARRAKQAGCKWLPSSRPGT